MLHIFWSCPSLQPFWATVRTVTQKFTDYKIQDDPAALLLHVTTAPTQRYNKSIVRHLLNAAKSCIPVMWKKKSTAPTVGMWLRRVEMKKWKT